MSVTNRTYRCVRVNVAVRVHARKYVVVEGLRQVCDHWVLAGEQLV
jgi:hypothetical protein